MGTASASVVVATYNQAGMVAGALESVLAQQWPALEVVVYDDHSTDGTWDEIQRVADAYDGPHALVLHRQSENVGPTINKMQSYARARGRWVIANDGDDRSLPGRVAAVVQRGEAARVGLVSSNALLIDPRGAVTGHYQPPGPDQRIGPLQAAANQWVPQMLGASYGFRSELFSAFPAIDPERLPSGGDNVWPLRAGIHFPAGMLYIGVPLLEYRQHAAQMTRSVADRTQGGLVFHETLAGHSITATMQKLRDVTARVQAAPGDKRLLQLRQAVLQSLVRQTEAWTRVRSGLINRGLRPTWVPRAQLDAVAVPDAFTPLDADAKSETESA